MTNIKNYDVKETAEIFKVSEQLVRKMIREKRLKAVKIGREWRVSEETISEMLNLNN